MRRWLQTTKIVPFNQRDNNGPALAAQAGALTKIQLVQAALNWSLCLFLLFLLLTQLLTILLSASSATNHVVYGRRPSFGASAIPGENDEPYSDRVLVCHRRSRRFEVTSVNEALMSASAILEDGNGTAMNGYRVVTRSSSTVNDGTKAIYSKTCSLISSTIEFIFSVCGDLGYLNLTRDTLRIVDGIDSRRLYRIPNSLPVLIMPSWDNGPTARYTIPGWDGQACMFRLKGKYEDPMAFDALMSGVNRSVRESKTIEWLDRPGGKWKNGWYEDTQGIRWYSDIQSVNHVDSDGIESRTFDMIDKRESDCPTAGCPPLVSVTKWGSSLQTTSKIIWVTTIVISNGKRYGLFLFEALKSDIVTCVYDFATFISDSSFMFLLLRWILSMLAVHRGYLKRVTSWHNTDIGCLANSYSFEALPITMLPRLKMILVAFYTVGCEFEGNQLALSGSWFVVYPAIVEIVLVFASLLNCLARIFRRRMSSWQIPASILLLSTMHYIRLDIGSSKLFGFDGRVSTIVLPQEFEQMSLFDVISPSAALRFSGNIKSLLWVRVSILFLNAVPLLFSQDMSLKSRQSQTHASCESEKSLCIRVCNIGGIGHSSMYEWIRQGTERRLALNAYEVVRLGYVVVGNTFLMTWENWLILAVIMPFRRVFLWRNYRFIVFDVAEVSGGAGHLHRISAHPYLVSMADPRLMSINWWDIDARSLV